MMKFKFTYLRYQLIFWVTLILFVMPTPYLAEANQDAANIQANPDLCSTHLCFTSKADRDEFWQENNCTSKSCQIASNVCDQEEVREGYTLLQIKQRLDKINAGLADPKQSASCASQKPQIDTLINQMTNALISNDVYSDSPQGYLPKGIERIPNNDAAKLAGLHLSPDDLVDEKSKFFASVYYNQNTKQYIVANRGTVFDQALNLFAGDNSVITDVKQALGYPTTQFDTDATNLANNIALAKSRNVVFTGHSLGGGLAALEATIIGGTAMTFDAGGVSNSTLARNNKENKQAKHIDNFYTEGEVLNQIQGKNLKDALACALKNEPIRTNLILSYLAHLAGAPDKDQAMSVPLPRAMGNQNAIPLTTWDAGYYTDDPDSLDSFQNRPGKTNSEQLAQPKTGTCLSDIIREGGYHSMDHVIFGLNYQLSQLLCH